MIKILKQKGSLIARCIVFQIAMSVLGFFVISAVANSGNTLILLAGIFTILFYFALVGATVNEDGLKDELTNKRSGLKPDIFLGIKYMAISYIPTFSLTLLLCLFRTFGIFAGAADIIVIFVRAFLTGMYFGIDMNLFIQGYSEEGYAIYSAFSSNGYSLLIYQLFSVIICGLFYYLGLRGINLNKTKEKAE